MNVIIRRVTNNNSILRNFNNFKINNPELLFLIIKKYISVCKTSHTSGFFFHNLRGFLPQSL